MHREALRPSGVQVLICFHIVHSPECECYGRASSCHYDPDVAMETGGSGGVCDNCTQNTAGQQCDECRPGFYRNATASVTNSNLCLRT